MSMPHIPNRRTTAGKVWGISVMRDESDIAGRTVSHFLRQGLDGIIIADNLSADGTREVVEGTGRGYPVYVGRDSEPGHYQAEKMSYLAYLAWRAGAEWIVPFDADEHWYAPGIVLAEYLRREKSDVIRAMMHDVQPLAVDRRLDFASGSRVRVCASLPPNAVRHESHKVAFRSGSGIHILSGNHEIARDGLRQDGLHLLHYKWRSPEQYFRKVRQGSAAMRIASADPSEAWHWRQRDGLTDDALNRSWEEVFREADGSDGAHWRIVTAPWDEWRFWPPGEIWNGLLP